MSYPTTPLISADAHLIGFVIGSIINLFWANSAFYWALTYLGIAVFIGLTAWDTQQIKRMSQQAHDDTAARRLAIIGALKLYLDFINLFVLLLRIFGSPRE
jgi:FtsH-binding integral membrane protein